VIQFYILFFVLRGRFIKMLLMFCSTTGEGDAGVGRS